MISNVATRTRLTHRNARQRVECTEQHGVTRDEEECNGDDDDEMAQVHGELGQGEPGKVCVGSRDRESMR